MPEESQQTELEKRMDRLQIYEEDLVEKFVLGSGSGGQKVNKTSNCVFLMHEPSGIHVKCQTGRTRAGNRYSARVLLCEKIEEQQDLEQTRRQQSREKKRRRHRRPGKNARARNVEEKRRHGEVKKLRKPPQDEED